MLQAKIILRNWFKALVFFLWMHLIMSKNAYQICIFLNNLKIFYFMFQRRVANGIPRNINLASEKYGFNI